MAPNTAEPDSAATAEPTTVHLAGGRLAAGQLDALADEVEPHGADLRLTSSGDIALAVPDRDASRARLAERGLAPVLGHTIVASPAGHGADIGPVVDRLHTALRAATDPGDGPVRAWGVDDGTGDIAAEALPVTVLAVSDDEYALILDGHDTGVRLSTADAAEAMVDTDRSRTTRVRAAPADTPVRAAPPRPVGWFDRPDGSVTLGGVLADGVLPPRLARFLAAVDRPLVVTPWNGIVVTDLPESAAEQVVRVLAPMGLVFDADSPHAR